MKKVIAVSGRALVLLFLGLSAMGISAADLEPYPTGFSTPVLGLENLSGQRHTPADYQGEVILVNFWATWCPPCLIEMPSMQRLKQALPDTPFSILAVNAKESKGKTWRFQQLLGVDFTVLLDKTGQAAEEGKNGILPCIPPVT